MANFRGNRNMALRDPKKSCRTLEDLLEGDAMQRTWPGDHMAEAYEAVFNCRPLAATRKMVRLISNQLDRFGLSNHSGSGNYLWVALEICRHMKYEYSVSVHRDGGGSITGYSVKLRV